MKKKDNHWCIICGKGYYACDSCSDVKSFTPWRNIADTVDHFKIYMTLKDFNNKLISKDEAKNQLSHVDLSEKDTFKESALKVLNEIYREDKKVIKAKKSYGKDVNINNTPKNDEDEIMNSINDQNV